MLVAVLAYGGLRWKLGALDRQIVEQQRREQELDLLLKQGEPTLQGADFLNQWEDRNINWLDEMRQMHSVMPGTERLYLNHWRFDTGLGDVAGKIEANGFALQQSDVDLLDQKLDDLPRHRVRPNEIGAGSSALDYPIGFEIDVDVESAAEK